MMRYLSILALLLYCLCQIGEVQAQPRTAGEWAWTTMLVYEGVSFSYIFYQHADHRNNGVVLKLTNANDYAVAYRFKIVFRAEGATVVEPVSDTLRAREVKTGDAEGLFWIPFKDGRDMAEVGLRGYKIVPSLPRGSSAAASNTR